MAKSKVVSAIGNNYDLDVQIVLRSSRLKLTDLREFNRLVVDFLSTQNIQCQVVSEDTLIQRDSERLLITLTTKLQSKD